MFTNKIRLLVAVLITGLAACSDPTAPVLKCTKPDAANFGGPAPCKDKVVVSTKDTSIFVFASEDASAPDPIGLVVTFTAGDKSYSAPYPKWEMPLLLVVDKNIGAGTLSVDGGSDYESKSWNNVSSGDVRHAAVLHPKCWTIRVGDYAGQTSCIPSAWLKADAGDNTSFFERPPNSATVWGWRETLFPVHVAFNTSYTAQNLLDADTVIQHINRTFGFKMAELGAMASDTIPIQGYVTVVKSQSVVESSAYIFGTDGNDILSGVIHIVPGSLFSFSHELIHDLGYGHTCKWKSRMASSTSCPNNRSDWFTQEDVAAIQIGQALRSQVERVQADLSWW